MDTRKPSSNESFEDSQHIDPDDEKIPPYKFRTDWGGLPAKKEDALLYYPLSTIIFTYTGGEECNTEEDCVRVMKGIQNRDMNERGLSDVQYNFYIGNDGYIYEGVGFVNRATKDPEFVQYDLKSFDVAFMGDYSDKDPGTAALWACRRLVDFMLETKVLTPDYKAITLSQSRELREDRIRSYTSNVRKNITNI